jgi:hypothetical protein
MPANSTGQLAIWKDAVAVASFALSPQDTGVRVGQIPGGGIDVDLPPAIPTDGDTYTVLDVDGSASLATAITVTPPSGTTIRGLATYSIFLPHGGAVFSFDSDTDDWSVFVSQTVTPVLPGAAGYVIFRPGVPSEGQAVETEEELPAALITAAGNSGAIDIYIDSSFAPANISAVNLNCGRIVRLHSYHQNFSGGGSPPGDLLTVTSPGHLTDAVYAGEGLHLIVGAGTMSWTGTQAFFINESATMFLAPGSGAPAYEVIAGQLFEVQGRNNAQFTGLAGVRLFQPQALAGSELIVFAFNFTEPTNNAFGNPAGGTFLYAQDASSTPQGGNFANVTTVLYVDAQAALAFTATTTAGRPATPRQGQMDFDTNLLIPIFWTGATWINAAGAPV